MFPLALNEPAYTAPVAPMSVASRLGCRTEATFQSQTEPSPPAVAASVRPPGLKNTELT